LRTEHGFLDQAVELPGGGTLRVELNHSDPTVLPSGMRLEDNDTRILSVAANLSAEGDEVVMVSKDLPMRVKASSVGIAAQEYRAQLAVESGWRGMAEGAMSQEEMSRLFDQSSVAFTDLHQGQELAELPCHTGMVLHSPSGSALGRLTADKQIRLVRGDREVFGLHGRSAEQ